MSEATPSRWDDLLDVFIAPGRLFARRSDGKFGHAMLVFIIAVAVLYFATRTAMQPIFEAEFQRSMASRPGMTPEQMEAGRKFAPIGAAIFVIVGTPIMMLVIGAMVWLATRLVGRTLSYKQGATIATFAMFPRLVESVVGAMQALLMDEGSLNSRYSVSLGLGRFLDPDNGLPVALLGRIDLFTIWVTVLIGIGIKVMTGATAGQAAAAAVMVWLLGALPALLQALLA